MCLLPLYTLGISWVLTLHSPPSTKNWCLICCCCFSKSLTFSCLRPHESLNGLIRICESSSIVPWLELNSALVHSIPTPPLSFLLLKTSSSERTIFLYVCQCQAGSLTHINCPKGVFQMSKRMRMKVLVLFHLHLVTTSRLDGKAYIIQPLCFVVDKSKTLKG